MRILLHDFGGYPFIAQLARALAQRNHDVLYLHADGLIAPLTSTVRRSSDPPRFVMDTVGLREPRHRHAGARRLLQERRFGAVLARRIAAEQPDAVVVANAPLPIQRAALDAAHASRAAFVDWLQDVHAVALRSLLSRRSRLLGFVAGSVAERTERGVVCEADAVVAISDDFRRLLERWGMEAARLAVIPNWAPLDEITQHPHDNEWGRTHGVGADRVNFLYAGTLGRKHDPAVLVGLAEGMPDARVIVVAEGAGMDRLRSLPNRPSNLVLLGRQAADEVPMMLASADVLLVLLEAHASAFSVPSKVLTYLAAGRPILGALPSDNLGARTIAVAGAGVIVDPADRQELVRAASILASDVSLRDTAGRKGRAYAEVHFDIEAITDQWETVLQSAVGRRMG